MGSKTKHIGLELTASGRPDSNTLFSSWRSCINGTGVGSNMELIDEAYGVMSAEIDNARSDIVDTRIELQQDISNVRDGLLEHITEALAMFNTINDNLETIRAEFDQKFSTAILDGDSIVIDCGTALDDI